MKAKEEAVVAEEAGVMKEEVAAATEEIKAIHIHAVTTEVGRKKILNLPIRKARAILIPAVEVAATIEIKEKEKELKNHGMISGSVLMLDIGFWMLDVRC